MTIRTSENIVTFRRPFVLSGFDEELPAGAYSVETEEELLEGISFPAYRRVLVLIHLHPKPGHPGVSQTLSIDPNDVDAALKRDQALAESPPSGSGCESRDAQADDGIEPREEADRQAIVRGEGEGEGEGIIVHLG